MSEPHDAAPAAEPAHEADAVAHGEAPAGVAPAPGDGGAHGPQLWVPAARAAVVTALEAGSARILDTPDGAQFAVVSTRLPRHRIGEYTALAAQEGLPTVVLVHPGGEALAVEALRGGCRMAIAEGDTDAIRALAGEPEPAGDDEVADRSAAILDAFEASLSRTQTTSRTPVALIDPLSGLPASGALQARLASMGVDEGAGLRVMSINIAALGERLRTRLGADAHAILHRRLALGLKLLCAGMGDIYDLGDGSFVLLANALDVPGAEQLGRRMAEVVESYMPDGHLPLTVAVGHAGPECSFDPGTLRELAARAELAALQEERSAVLGAGELVRSLATTTELEVTLRLAEMAANMSDGPAAEAVAATASAIATRLGFEGRDRMLVRFCAMTASVGAVLAPEAAEQLKAAAALIGAVAGPAAGSVIATIDERWDGSGPTGLAGPDIPMAARIIAVARRIVADGNTTQAVEQAAGASFDPAVVQAATDVLKGAA